VCCTYMVTDVCMVSVYPILLLFGGSQSWVSCSVFSLKCQKSGVVFVVLFAKIIYAELLYGLRMCPHCDV
jgi:hypothetical protein